MWLKRIDDASTRSMKFLRTIQDPIEALHQMKFNPIGIHPIDGRELNLIEQVNQTFTYKVALKAAAWLLAEHPDAGGFSLAPGAAMSLPLDIMSVKPSFVGAETFAATHPDSNRKLTKDLTNLSP